MLKQVTMNLQSPWTQVLPMQWCLTKAIVQLQIHLLSIIRNRTPVATISLSLRESLGEQKRAVLPKGVCHLDKVWVKY